VKMCLYRVVLLKVLQKVTLQVNYEKVTPEKLKVLDKKLIR